MAAQGICLFSLNYILFYRASFDMPSGLLAICFSTITLMNILNGALFFRTPVDARVFIGALLGLAGLGLVFWPEVAGFGLHSRAALGLALSLLATAFASLGNMVSVRHKLARHPGDREQCHRHGLWRALLARHRLGPGPAAGL